jgi:hypothetical protein
LAFGHSPHYFPAPAGGFFSLAPRRERAGQG